MCISNIILGIGIGVIASWLLGFLLIDKEALCELENENSKTT